MRNLFENVAMTEKNEKWNNIIKREKELYKRNNDIRSEIERDYTRIIHSTAYRRMRHKTQVFFSPENDHICTRIEHATYVESISHTIAKYLGLNIDLTKAIATAHDLGHAPFGHEGERVLSKISQRDLGERFWHEKNGLDFVDKLEVLEDNFKNEQNLNLTYGVRDGIISHCGEIDENALRPRDEYINLSEYKYPNQYAPYTWEACVVKVSDKISYIGRDIEDAIKVGILDKHLSELYKILKNNPDEAINNTIIMNNLIKDLCENSSPENGLCFSQKMFDLMNELKKFNYEYIYLSDRLRPSSRYFDLVLNEIYNTLKNTYDRENTLNKISKMKKFYPDILNNFEEWLSKYWTYERKENSKNEVLFNIADEKDYTKAIIYYISGMTDNFVIEMYNKIIGF